METLMNEDCKKKCQIFTPISNVNEMLDWVGYSSDLYGKKVLEPSFGKGNILKEIVKRYIEDCLKNKIKISIIKAGLENDIYGVEYDKVFYDMCINELDSFVFKYGIKKVKWNFVCGDSLKLSYDFGFDYVIGNPPYISYKNLDYKTREFVRSNFEVCKEGKFDYCYAFIESGINSLKSGGKICFLIPGSIFKNVFSEKLRNYIISDITDIYDYGSRKLFHQEGIGKFRNILTSSAVFILKKNSSVNFLRYHSQCDELKSRLIYKSTLGEKWIFSDSIEPNGRRFGDYFKAANTIATLYNKAFVIHEDNFLFYNLDSLVIREAASPKSLERGIKEKIIFPYYYYRGLLRRFREDIFENLYGEVCGHLRTFDKELKLRKSDRNINWYEYGRSQALNDMNQKKLLLSIVVTGKVKVYTLGKDVIPYSGIYIIPTSNMNLKQAKKILESQEFYEYIKNVGIHASGDSFRITSKDINNYYFE